MMGAGRDYGASAALLLNGGVLAEHALEGLRLPLPAPPEEYEARERWDVALYGRDGLLESIPCGFAAVKTVIQAGRS